MGGHFLIALLLPRPYREAWQCVALSVETAVVGTNYSAGINLSF